MTSVYTVEFGSRSDCMSIGRNGTIMTSGIQATLYVTGRLERTVDLIPITSKGNVANCCVEMPVSEFLKIADWLREQLGESR